ncbi:hypothetical protein K469DRAFT_711217 [Zopfia rhizophila CBS 207.26]|uniref:Transposase IS30-like HTH domain-containing protein n=1 Tax=Zopfia rhizophila CBS 207.26 TaxID=1314779 RepID=A0A6A6DW24_9PEZI|nr:hypothetical protein K469DRAFT_711217 [Zopfia rhizophila CBS 207.26]
MPATPPSKHLNRDERLQVQTLRLAGHSQQFIANLLGFTRRQVQYADTSERVTLKKRSGQNPTLINKLISYLQLASRPFSDWQVGEYEQWCLILWSDETWVTGGRYKKQWVTRRAGEELVDTCMVDKIRKRRGWMFWGCFTGDEKGPCLFWKKEWGSINKTSYCKRVVPLIHDWIRMNPHL